MRGRTGYVISVMALLGGLGLGWLIRLHQARAVAAELQQIVVPGAPELSLPKPGVYTIFHEQRAIVAGRYFASDRQLNGLKLRLQSLASGEDVAINPPAAYAAYTTADREGASIATFEIPHAGSYRLTAWYPEPAHDSAAVLAIGPGLGATPMVAILGSLAAAGAVLAAGVLAVATFVRRRRATRRPNNRTTVEEVPVRVKVLCIACLLSMAGQAFAQERTDPSRPPLASVDARWDQVFCDLTELARTGVSELSVRYRYRNTRKAALRLPHGNLVPRTRVFDPASRVLFGVMMDSSGSPISSTMMSGQAARPVPAGGTQAHWVRIQAPPDAVKSVTVMIEGCQPFDDVAIGGTASAEPLSAPAQAIATQEGEGDGIVAEITSAKRTAGGFLTVTFRYRNTGARQFAFPNERRVQAAYYLDSGNRRKYEVVRSQQQEPLCSDALELVGQAGEKLAPGLAIAMWAKFAAPPDATKTISIHLPFAPPFADVPLSGATSGSAGGGSAVGGTVVGLEAALKDLNAKVNEAEIRIDLSADVLFDFDKADIRKEAEPSLQKVATVLNANPGSKVTIEGHTDGKGTDAYNQTLSEQRAASVKQWLVANAKVSGANVATRGWGKSKPVANNTRPDGSDDPQGREKNRRVEIVVRKGA